MHVTFYVNDQASAIFMNVPPDYDFASLMTDGKLLNAQKAELQTGLLMTEDLVRLEGVRHHG